MKRKLAFVLIIAGVFILALPFISNMLLKEKEDSVDIDNIPKNRLEQNAERGDKSFDQSKVKPIDINGVILNREKADMSKVIGQMTIPSINKNIAIFDGLENNNLMYGACTMKPDQKMGTGNFAIAGHYCKKDNVLFGGLFNIKKGDIIKLTNKRNIYEYEVVNMFKTDDTRTDLIGDGLTNHDGGKAMVSLMTCYKNENGYRYFVIGRFKKLYPYSEAKMLEGITDK